MHVRLSDRDASRLHATLEVLLAPLCYDDVAGWGGAVMEALRDLFHADRALFILPRDEGLTFLGSGLEAHTLQALQAPIVDVQPERFHYADDRLRRVARVATGPWSNRGLNRLSGGVYFRTPYFQEVIRPNGLAHGAGLTIPLPLGEGRLGVAHTRPGDDPFGEATTSFLFQTLLPAFRAAADVRLRLEARRATLTRTLDAVGDALLVCDAAGRVLHQTPALQRLLSAEPERERVLAAAHAFARSLSARTSAHALREPAQTGEQRWHTATAQYLLRGSLLAAGLIGRDEGILVVLRRLTPALPSAAALRARYGLTEREAEVARELAVGRSNREVAERLCISAHTVRHHAEHVFGKLGVHTRKALALKLMEAH